MRWVASQRVRSIRKGQDGVYTDWSALERFLEDWAGVAALA